MTPLLEGLMSRLGATRVPEEARPTQNFAALLTEDATVEVPSLEAPDENAERTQQEAPTALPSQEHERPAPVIPFDLVVPLAPPVARPIATEIEPAELGIPVEAGIPRGKAPRLAVPHAVPVRPAEPRAEPRLQPRPEPGPERLREAVPHETVTHAPLRVPQPSLPSKTDLAVKPLAAPAAPLEATPVPKRIDIVLEPERLGRVRMTLTLAGTEPRLRIVAATEAGFAALTADRDALLPILREVRGGEGEVRISLQSEPAANAAGQSESWTFERPSDRNLERGPEREARARGERDAQPRNPDRRDGRERHDPRDPDTL